MTTWLGIAALGAFHGLNPAMGWLFAVALGQQEGRSAAVLRALPPIAFGHLLSVGGVVGVALAVGAVLPLGVVRVVGGLLLAGFAGWLLLGGRGHAGWRGMRLGTHELVAWSIAMATAHGAGLMLLPAVLGVPHSASAAPHHAHGALPPLTMLAIHTGAMLLAMGLAAMAAHRLVGLGFLRRRWFNLQFVWVLALLLAAATMLMP